MANASGPPRAPSASRRPTPTHVQLRSEQRAFEVDDVGNDLGWGGGPLLRPHDIASGLVLESGALIRAYAVAAVPVDRRAAERKVDGRHHATPVHEPGQIGEPVWIVHPDEIPLARLRPQCATSAEHAAAQQHAVTGFTRLDRERSAILVFASSGLNIGCVPPVWSNRR